MKLSPTSPEPGVILAFGAHPDDVEFGCGAVIAQAVRGGGRAHLVVCSRGEAATNGTPEDRVREAGAAAEILGATLEFVDLGGDAHLEYGVAQTLVLAAIIRRLKPRIVLAPTTVENQHPDHVVVGRLVRDAARLARYGGVAELRALPAHAIDSLLAFAVTPEGEPREEAPVLINISEPAVLETWTAAMEAHASQLKTRNYVELQLCRARLNGLRAGVSHATALFPTAPLLFSNLASLGVSARRF